MDQIHSSCVFPSLESLWLHKLTNLETMCHGELPANSFNKLRKVDVSNCDKLKNLFPLREDHDAHYGRNEAEFTELRHLSLCSLPKFVHFCWSKLEATHGSLSIDPPKPLFNAKVLTLQHI